MADLSLATLVEGKPVKIEKDGKTICVTRVGEDVFAMTRALILMHLFQRVMYLDSKLNAGYMAQNLIYARVKHSHHQRLHRLRLMAYMLTETPSQWKSNRGQR